MARLETVERVLRIVPAWVLVLASVGVLFTMGTLFVLAEKVVP